jgi:hypothetical protein
MNILKPNQRRNLREKHESKKGNERERERKQYVLIRTCSPLVLVEDGGRGARPAAPNDEEEHLEVEPGRTAASCA